ncbi:MAG: MFS transporter [Gammaproteobacteria bacterium]
MPAAVPYAPLSAFYLFYFGAVGVVVPFFSFYLKHRGLDSVTIGQLMAIPMLMRVIAPGLWGWVADRSGRRRDVLRFGAVAAAGGAVLISLEPGPAGLAAALAAFALPWSGLLPQYEANTLSHLGLRPHRYGLVRLWGSLGFILAVVAGGIVFEGAGVARVPAAILVLVTCVALAVWRTPVAPRSEEPGEAPRFRAVLFTVPVVSLFVVCFLQQAAFGPYYVFFTIYLEGLGYSTAQAGLLWAWGVAAEVVMFLYTARLLERFGSRALMIAALAATSLRWALTAWAADSPPALVLAQTMHMASFGLFHAVAVVMVHRYFRGRLQGRGQALYSAAGFGLGGAFGSLASGYVWEFASPASAYAAAAAVAGLATLVAWLGIQRGERG